MLRSSPTALLFLGVLAMPMYFASTSCASAPAVVIDAAPAQMYEAMSNDMDRRGGSAAVFDATVERQEARYAEMARRVLEEELASAEEHFYAGAILVRSSEMEHLLLAESVGRKAAILGDKRGHPVAAEAVDRQALIEGTAQTYGTQYAYNYVTGNWQLYLVKEETTDEERAAVGLPPLAWFEDRVRQLNASAKSDHLRRELKLPPVK